MFSPFCRISDSKIDRISYHGDSHSHTRELEYKLTSAVRSIIYRVHRGLERHEACRDEVADR